MFNLTFYTVPLFFRHQKDSGSWSIYKGENFFNENCILEFLSFWISRLFDLGDLSVLENGSLKYFENGLKSMQIFQTFMGGMNRR